MVRGEQRACHQRADVRASHEGAWDGAEAGSRWALLAGLGADADLIGGEGHWGRQNFLVERVPPMPPLVS